VLALCGLVLLAISVLAAVRGLRLRSLSLASG
jgi:hypothetical protein